MKSIIAICLLLSLHSQIYGQGAFTPVPYNFADQIPTSFTPLQGTILEAACLTSDGYGNWFADFGKEKFFLYGDTLQDEVSSTPTIPSGLIASGRLSKEKNTGNLEIKATSNLNGNVRYVWPTGTVDANGNARTYFEVRGFNDNRMSPSQIDITFSGIPNAPNSRNVVKSGIAVYPGATTIIGTAPHAVVLPSASGVGLNYEADWRDVYDICCDAVHLYIVWESFTNNPTINKFSTFVTVLNISDGSTVAGYPKPVSQAPNGNRRPTIGCDVRNADPNVNSYLIAEITPALQATGNNGIQLHYENSGVIATTPLDNHFINPQSSNGSTVQYFAKHARVVYGSTNGTQCQIQGVYVIANGNPDTWVWTSPGFPGDDIIFHRITKSGNTYAGDGPATYIDGMHNTSHPSPIPQQAYQIVDQYIQAFANPYDGEPNIDYNEFHCLYQFQISNYSNGHPLLIAGGHPSSPAAPTATLQKYLLSKLVGCPTIFGLADNPGMTYLASVNQMGIHVYWKGDQSLTNSTQRIFYARDVRSFDEPIEENTLLTYYNQVVDGRSHFGTLGATLQPGRIMTMWTDPTVNNGGLYLAGSKPDKWNNCNLAFSGADTKLQIGLPASPIYDAEGIQFLGYAPTWATLVTMPNFEVHFGDNCQTTHFQSLVVEPGSTWQYYGVPPNLAWPANFSGSGEIHLLGSGLIVPSTSNPTATNIIPSIGSRMFIHGGSTFIIPNQVTLKDTSAHIECLFEPEIRTINVTTTNNNESGIIQLNGAAVLKEGRVISHIPASFTGNVNYIRVKPDLPNQGTSCTSLDPQLVSNGSVFANETGNSTTHLASLISADGNLSATNTYRTISFTNGIHSAVSIDFADPVYSVTIDGSLFRNSMGTVVHFHRDYAFPYDNNHILNCNFALVNQNVSPILFDGANGFNTARTSAFDKILLDGNIITTIQSNSTTNPVAITFNKTDGKISGNTINGNDGGLAYGIQINGPDATYSNTFLCSNLISHCSVAGISSNNWKGIGRLNTVTTSGVGHLFGSFNSPAIISNSNYTNNTGAGLKINGGVNRAVILMYFLYVTGEYDEAGYNTIAENNQSGSSTSGQIVFEDYGNNTVIFGNTALSGSRFNHNNLIANNTTSDLFAYAASTLSGCTIKSANDNFFATGTVTSPLNYTLATSGDAMFHNVSYLDASHQAGSFNSTSGVSCSNGYLSVAHIADNVVITPRDTTTCIYLERQGIGYGNGIKYRFAYDTLRLYVESCYSILPVEHEFGSISSACYGMEALKDTVWAEYRDWLKSVLYNKTDSFYVCEDLRAYAFTFVHHDERGHDIDFKTCLSIFNYLKDSSLCSILVTRSDIKNIWTDYYGYWKYTLHHGDTVNFPFDSTLPGIDQAGQGFLHGFAGVENSDGTIANATFGSIRANENPFKRELHLSYEVLRPTVAKLEIYDALGRQLFTNGQGYLEVGEHNASINSSDWSSGTYYARLVTLRGQVKTLKIVKD